jgi:hypothetical protein
MLINGAEGQSETFKYYVPLSPTMRKEVKKDGNSHVIRLDAEDMKVYGLKLGDVVDIEICKIRSRKTR